MSIVLLGWGSPFAPLTYGYGAAPATLPPGTRARETFRVPVPDGFVATRHGVGAPVQPPYLGSDEADIAFAIDFAGWLGTGEALSVVQPTCWAFPVPAGSSPSEQTLALVQAAGAVGSQAVVVFHNAQPQTFYVVTIVATTTLDRTLECRMPRIWCPD